MWRTFSTGQYEVIGEVAVDYCVHIGRTDILFGTVFDRFAAAGMRDTFLLLLKPYILSDRLRSLPAVVLNSLVDCYSHAEVERCIIHLSIMELDIDKVVKMCTKHCLFDALIYVYNRGLNDYTTPIEIMLGAVEDGAEIHGLKLILYLNYSLRGRAYPRGQIPFEGIAIIRADILSTIFEETSMGFPVLSALLKIDSAEILSLLAIVFDDDEQQSASEEGQRLGPSLQLMMDALITVMLDRFDCIALFAAHYYLRHAIELGSDVLVKVFRELISANEAKDGKKLVMTKAMQGERNMSCG